MGDKDEQSKYGIDGLDIYSFEEEMIPMQDDNFERVLDMVSSRYPSQPFEKQTFLYHTYPIIFINVR